ncbi:ATP-dependent RNA helicase dbp6 [Pichia californica]|uniref:ATP-dependent RNA helicase n=1 Tax=Pichia californica TaxID=460514 RepID=A0A9P6WKF3_9ASCO|nr:ATP-dependent RNA helicase dbp6 [[Candida] californica]KAG0688785.1 ATP-dependent RNA helicase dbp6 [[Candida] californica]
MFASRFDPSASNNKDDSNTKARLLNKLKKKNKEDNIRPSITIEKQNKDTEINQQSEQDYQNKEIAKNEVEKLSKLSLKRKRDDLSDNIDTDSEENDSDSSEDVDSNDSDDSDDSESDNDPADEDIIMSDGEQKAHSSVLSRFKTAMSKQSKVHHTNEEEEEEEEKEEEGKLLDVKDVAPLPQLKLPRDKQLYSHSYKNQNLDWLTKPAYYDSGMTKPFKDFHPSIDELILKNLENEFKIKDAFSVQITLIQELLKDIIRGRLDPTPRGDYLINAATGSGKTLSYLIPIIQYIIGSSNQTHIKDSGVKCIIIVPTKPLVQQVYSDSLKLTKGSDINIMALKSGTDMSILEERKKIESNIIDILITTPGRIVEHIEYLETKSLRFLVVDEADRLLNQTFQDWCDLLMNRIENFNQLENKGLDQIFSLRCIKIVLSATLTANSEKLTHLRLFKPRLVIVNSDNSNELYQLPKLLDEKYIRISEKLSYFKPLILLRLFQWIDKNGNNYNNFGLIFTKSNESSIKLNKLLNLIINNLGLENIIKVRCINSMMDNQERAKIMKQFDENGGILICTDLLSRGINLSSIKFVINYDLPGSTKEYVHRIGRTARAGKIGNAITLCYGDAEFKWFKKVVYSGQQINRNNKNIIDIKFIKDLNDYKEDKDEDKEKVDFFQLNLTDDEKELYEKCLKNL